MANLFGVNIAKNPPVTRESQGERLRTVLILAPESEDCGRTMEGDRNVGPSGGSRNVEGHRSVRGHSGHKPLEHDSSSTVRVNCNRASTRRSRKLEGVRSSRNHIVDPIQRKTSGGAQSGQVDRSAVGGAVAGDGERVAGVLGGSGLSGAQASPRGHHSNLQVLSVGEGDSRAPRGRRAHPGLHRNAPVRHATSGGLAGCAVEGPGIGVEGCFASSNVIRCAVSNYGHDQNSSSLKAAMKNPGLPNPGLKTEILLK